MIKNIGDLKKIDDILSLEGTILGLHKDRDKLCLSSCLKDGSGTVYYSVNELTLAKYLNNELRLRDVYLASEDTLVLRKSPMEAVYFFKEYLTELISCGERSFLENSDRIKNDMLVQLFTR
jgi:hypothetical protein